MTTGDGGLSPSSSVVPAVDAPPPFFAGGGGRIAVDDSATFTGTATGGTRGRLVLVRPKFGEETPAIKGDTKKPSPTSGVAEDAASSAGIGAPELHAPRKIQIASRRPRTDTSENGASPPRLSLPWTATAAKGTKRRKLVRPPFGVRTLRISSKADAGMAIEALKTGEDVKIAISEDLPLADASEVAHVILPFHPRVLEGPDLLLLCNKISEQAAVNARLQINQSALVILETRSKDLHLSIARDRAMLG